MHVNPVTSDGNFTIGYDADGVAGQWPGNMAESIETVDFYKAKEGDVFNNGNEDLDCYLNGDELVWRDQEGDWESVAQTLKRYGDK